MNAEARRRAGKRLLTPKTCRECGELVYWDDTEPVVCDECRVSLLKERDEDFDREHRAYERVLSEKKALDEENARLRAALEAVTESDHPYDVAWAALHPDGGA